MCTELGGSLTLHDTMPQPNLNARRDSPHLLDLHKDLGEEGEPDVPDRKVFDAMCNKA